MRPTARTLAWLTGWMLGIPRPPRPPSRPAFADPSALSLRRALTRCARSGSGR